MIFLLIHRVMNLKINILNGLKKKLLILILSVKNFIILKRLHLKMYLY